MRKHNYLPQGWVRQCLCPHKVHAQTFKEGNNTYNAVCILLILKAFELLRDPSLTGSSDLRRTQEIEHVYLMVIAQLSFLVRWSLSLWLSAQHLLKCHVFFPWCFRGKRCGFKRGRKWCLSVWMRSPQSPCRMLRSRTGPTDPY